MTLGASFRIAVRAMAANPLRSLLTALGVIIGVGAVIAMVAIGQGARRAVTDQVQALGSNLLTVFAGQAQIARIVRGDPVQTLNIEDAEEIRKTTPGVTGVSAEYSRQAQVVFRAENVISQISGVTPEFQEVRNFRPARGEFFTEQEMRSRAKVAVVGKTVADRLFPDTEPIGQRIKIRGITFTVIGVMEEKGATSFTDRDDIVFVPLATAQRRLFGVTHVRTIHVQVASAEEMPAAQEALTELLRQRHRLAPHQENDFTVRSQADILQTFTSVSQTMTVLLGGIAAVSLVVGGIGIMNIMLVSVTERTREIGIRMAVGARRRDIMLQFLVESVALSVGGGLIGIGVGVMGSQLISRFAGWATLLSLQAVLLAFAFAVAVGVFFGLYPAQRAARLDPIVALRHE
ncbi:MAG: FtsX-like permease family protein [Armatimonadetes bacterium]|nr:FtsX-like permease family protein [Armatimonadota bacterium]